MSEILNYPCKEALDIMECQEDKIFSNFDTLLVEGGSKPLYSLDKYMNNLSWRSNMQMESILMNSGFNIVGNSNCRTFKEKDFNGNFIEREAIYFGIKFYPIGQYGSAATKIGEDLVSFLRINKFNGIIWREPVLVEPTNIKNTSKMFLRIIPVKYTTKETFKEVCSYQERDKN